jgi:hypothetical protein
MAITSISKQRLTKWASENPAATITDLVNAFDNVCETHYFALDENDIDWEDLGIDDPESLPEDIGKSTIQVAEKCWDYSNGIGSDDIQRAASKILTKLGIQHKKMT